MASVNGIEYFGGSTVSGFTANDVTFNDIDCKNILVRANAVFAGDIFLTGDIIISGDLSCNSLQAGAGSPFIVTNGGICSVSNTTQADGTNAALFVAGGLEMAKRLWLDGTDNANGSEGGVLVCKGGIDVDKLIWCKAAGGIINRGTYTGGTSGQFNISSAGEVLTSAQIASISTAADSFSTTGGITGARIKYNSTSVGYASLFCDALTLCTNPALYAYNIPGTPTFTGDMSSYITVTQSAADGVNIVIQRSAFYLLNIRGYNSGITEAICLTKNANKSTPVDSLAAGNILNGEVVFSVGQFGYSYSGVLLAGDTINIMNQVRAALGGTSIIFSMFGLLG